MFRSTFLVLALAVPAAAQKTMQAMPGTGQLTQTGHFIAMMENSQFVAPVAFAMIVYTPSTWKADWNDQTKLDTQTIGHTFRLGKNNWATLDLSAPIVFGDVTVPVGIWYLGVCRDKAGKWALAFIDPAKAKAAGAWPPSPLSDLAPHAHEAALAVGKATANVDTLKVTMSPDEKAPTKGTFTIEWGNMKATATYEMKVPPAAADANAKDTGKKK
ncbi:MAG TPA: hypothetical protein VFZ65_19285 [Planctomycetota bacterium]|nr:hypothetical protein [Planctomycetota bacterium]